MTQTTQLPGARKARGTGTDDGHRASRVRSDRRAAPLLQLTGEVMIAEEALKAADRHRLSLAREHARDLTLLLLRADTPAHRGQRVALLQDRNAVSVVAIDDVADERLDVDVHRTARDARGVLALQAPLRLRARLLLVIAERHLVEVPRTLGGLALRHRRAWRTRRLVALYGWHEHSRVYSASARRSSSV
jgi:hypothetical protein